MKTYNAAIIGAAGWIGGLHSDCWIRAAGMLPEGVRVKLHTAVDVNEAAVKKTAQRYGYEKFTSSFEAAMADPEVDVIDICCSNHLHREVAVKALAAGKAVICEKPIAISLDDAAEMVEASEKFKAPSRMAFMYRKYPAVCFIRQMIDRGDLGQLLNLRIQFEQDFYCDPGEPYTWRFSMATSGGGALVSLGTHVLDLCRYLAGDVDSLVADAGTLYTQRPLQRGSAEMGLVDVDDWSSALLRFKNGAAGFVHANWVAHGRKHHVEFELTGTKGVVLFNSERLNEIQYCDGESDPLKRGFTTILIGADHPYGEFFSQKTGMGIGIKEAFTLQIADFIRDLEDWQGRGASFRDGYENLLLVKKIQESVSAGGWVRV